MTRHPLEDLDPDSGTANCVTCGTRVAYRMKKDSRSGRYYPQCAKQASGHNRNWVLRRGLTPP